MFSLELMFQVFLIDMSGLTNCDSITPKASLLVSPEVIRRIKIFTEDVGVNEHELEHLYFKEAESFVLPYAHYSTSATWEMLRNALMGI